MMSSDQLDVLPDGIWVCCLWVGKNASDHAALGYRGYCQHEANAK